MSDFESNKAKVNDQIISLLKVYPYIEVKAAINMAKENSLDRTMYVNILTYLENKSEEVKLYAGVFNYVQGLFRKLEGDEFETLRKNIHKRVIEMLSLYPYKDVSVAMEAAESGNLDQAMSTGILNHLSKNHKEVAAYAAIIGHIQQINANEKNDIVPDL